MLGQRRRRWAIKPALGERLLFSSLVFYDPEHTAPVDAGLMLAVSYSPRPRIDVFALPEKSNMAVTESDHNFLMTANTMLVQFWVAGSSIVPALGGCLMFTESLS